MFVAAGREAPKGLIRGGSEGAVLESEGGRLESRSRAEAVRAPAVAKEA